MSLFARKSIDAAHSATGHGLRRVMGAGDPVMLAIGAVIGAGIFSSFPSSCSAACARSPACAMRSWPR